MQPLLRARAANLPAELNGRSPLTAQRWANGVHKEDAEIRRNIFVCFGEFEQALARLNMALMLDPGGFALSNDRLPGSAADGLADSLETTQIFARNPDRTEYMFTYQRRR